MNIFFLSLIPTEIAHMSCDQHVVKIQLEICQMLYTAWYFSGEEDIHGYIKDMCGTCDERKGNVCSVLKKTLEYTLQRGVKLVSFD